MDSKESTQINGASKAKPRISMLAIASFVVCLLVSLIMVIYWYYEEAVIFGLNDLFFNESSLPLARFQTEICEKISFILTATSILLGIAAIRRIALSSKRLKGYFLVIAGIILVLIASFLCAMIVLSQIGTIS